MLEVDNEMPILIFYIFAFITLSSYLTSTIIQEIEEGNRKIIKYYQIDDVCNSTLIHNIINENKVLYNNITKEDDILLIIDNSPSSFLLLILIDTLFPENSVTVFNYGNKNTCYIKDLCDKLEMNFTNFNNNYILNSKLHLYTHGLKKICNDQKYNHCFTNINNDDYIMLLHESIYLDKYSNNLNDIIYQKHEDVNVYNPLCNIKYETIREILDDNNFVIENVKELYYLYNENDYMYIFWRDNIIKKYKELCNCKED